MIKKYIEDFRKKLKAESSNINNTKTDPLRLYRWDERLRKDMLGEDVPDSIIIEREEAELELLKINHNSDVLRMYLYDKVRKQHRLWA